MGSSSSYPGWAYLLAGIAMGLFIAFLVYLKNLPEHDSDTVKRTAHGDSKSDPSFDFYTILPELEIVVPESDDLKDIKSKTTEKHQDLTQDKSNEGDVYVLQIGSFKDSQQADKLKASLALIGLEAHIQRVKVDNQTWHRVRLGPFENRQSLLSARRRLQENDYRSITLKVNG